MGGASRTGHPPTVHPKRTREHAPNGTAENVTPSHLTTQQRNTQATVALRRLCRVPFIGVRGQRIAAKK